MFSKFILFSLIVISIADIEACFDQCEKARDKIEAKGKKPAEIFQTCDDTQGGDLIVDWVKCVCQDRSSEAAYYVAQCYHKCFSPLQQVQSAKCMQNQYCRQRVTSCFEEPECWTQAYDQCKLKFNCLQAKGLSDFSLCLRYDYVQEKVEIVDAIETNKVDKKKDQVVSEVSDQVTEPIQTTISSDIENGVDQAQIVIDQSFEQKPQYEILDQGERTYEADQADQNTSNNYIY